MKKLTKKDLELYLNKLGIVSSIIFLDIYTNLFKNILDKRFKYGIDCFEFEPGLYTVLICRIDKTDVLNLQFLEIVQSNDENIFEEKKAWLFNLCKQ